MITYGNNLHTIRKVVQPDKYTCPVCRSQKPAEDARHASVCGEIRLVCNSCYFHLQKHSGEVEYELRTEPENRRGRSYVKMPRRSNFVPQTSKECTHCHEIKPATEFRKRESGRLRSWCKPCEEEHRREYLRARRAAKKEADAKAYAEMIAGNYERIGWPIGGK